MGSFLIGQKVLPSGNFVFFDTETANRYNEICQIAAIIIENGYIKDIFQKYVKPINDFEFKHHIEEHGITREKVQDAKSFNYVWQECFEKYIEDFIFVAHNIESADLTFIKSSLEMHECIIPKINYICTMKLSQEWLPGLDSYKRESMCEYLGKLSNKNHEALSDTEDCLYIYLKLYEKFNFDYNTFVCDNKSTIKKKTKANEHKSSDRLTKEEKLTIKKNEILDADFEGKRVVVTGTFQRYPNRKDLEKVIGQRGGATPPSVSSVTDMLIIGQSYGPDKFAKAKAMGIPIINEETLYKMLDNGNEKL